MWRDSRPKANIGGKPGSHHAPPPPPGGGGEGVLTPNFGRYMCRGKVKNWQGLRNELPVEREMWGSGTSLSRFERENAGLRNELDPFWAWKCESPERPLTRGAAERFAFGLRRPWEPMNGLKLKKFWKLWSPEPQNPPKNVKWWCSWTDFFLWVICEKWYAPERKFRAENGGLSRGTYPICIHNGSTPPPPPQLIHKIEYVDRLAYNPCLNISGGSSSGSATCAPPPKILIHCV